MKRSILIVAMLTLTPAGLLAQSPSQYKSRDVELNLPQGQGGPVLGKPLSATEVYRTVQVLSDGTHVDHTNTSQFYRDDQGRMRSESPERVLIFDPVAGHTYDLDVKKKTYSRSLVSGNIASAWIATEGTRTSISMSSDALPAGDPAVRYARAYRNAVSARPMTEELPPQSMNGLWVKGSRITITIPAGTFGNDRDVKVINERWYSDDLKVLVKSINSDPRYGVTTYELTQVVQAPPNPELLRVPSDYRLAAGH